MQRSLFNLKFLPAIVALLFLVAMSDSAFAQASNANIYENVLDRYQVVASSWAAAVTRHASRLFWTLALISMVWTFGMMALRKADIGEFFAELVRFTIFTGFFWWLLTNGPNFADTIIRSLRQIGGEATGLGSNLTPSTVADIGFDVFFNTLDKATMRSPLVSAVGILLGLGVLLLLALVAVNMLILLVSAWVLLYGGVFFLGFGGARWTSNMAINYYKTVLGLAASLFAMVLVIGVATSIIDEYYRAMGPDIQLKELTVVMIVAFIMAMLIKSIPPLISGIITGASIGQGGTMGFGAGAIVGVGAMGASAIAMGGAAIAAGTASAAGGAQALMAAYTKASAASSGGIGSHGMGDMMGGAAIAAANLSGSSSGGGSVFAGMDSANSSGSGFSGSGSRLEGGFGSSASESGSSTEKGKDSSESGTTPDAKGKADAAGKPTGSDAKAGGPGSGLAPGEQRATGSMLGRAASIAAGTAGNLALGTWDVAKAKASNMRESAFDRIGETTGGKIATAIRARDAQAPAPSSAAPADMAFNGNELSAGKAQAQTADASEVAAFVNRSSKTS